MMILLKKLHLTIGYVWLRIFAHPVISWPMAGFVYYLIDGGINGDFIMFGAKVTYEELFILLMIALIVAPVILPFALKKRFPHGLKYRLSQFKKPEPIKKTEPVKVVVPAQNTDGIAEIVARLPPHLQRLLVGEGG